MTNHLQLWGKARPVDEDGPRWHPLAFHILDVAAVAEQLLRLRPQRLDAMARALGLDQKQALPWLVFFVAVHDLGKATPPFQRIAVGHDERLKALGFDFGESEEPHGGLSTLLIPSALERLGLPLPLARTVAKAVGAHHGDFATNAKWLQLEDYPALHVGKKPAWRTARETLLKDLFRLVGVPAVEWPAIDDSSRQHAFAADLAGLTTTADWLGSDAKLFRYTDPSVPLEDYWRYARETALRAAERAGFRPVPPTGDRTFQELFGRTPWPLHDASEEVVHALPLGSLVIVEAPMGEGKTEAALLAFDRFLARGAEGLFFALPTQATANQILKRVERFLRASYPGPQGLHLVHGGAALSAEYGALKQRAWRAQSIDGVGATERDQGPVADAWFVGAKRALIAPFGVGTVDQALLGVLRAKHHFLRLHGLAGKVFIVDEVHAYDTFTSTIVARLCEWLAALGASVVLLSATLYSGQRARLIEAFGAQPPASVPPYPRITAVSAGGTGSPPTVISHALTARRPSFPVEIVWKPREALAAELALVMDKGGNVAWIVNTVARAQELYLELVGRRDRGELPADVEIHLLHARLPFEERLRRESSLSERYGPPSPSVQRPHASILIGTQVLEQSLDFDFDLMITELAPVDLVLQRSGRLHRHERANRPVGMSSRRLWVEVPEAADKPTGPTFGKSVYIYDEATLLSSYLALCDRSTVVLPDDIEPLVEQVYGALPANVGTPEARARLNKLAEERDRQSVAEANQADTRLLPAPGHDDPFGNFCCRFDEEDPEVHETLKAITRLGEPSLTVVPVIECSRPSGRPGLALAQAPEVSFAEDEEIPIEHVVKIAKSAIQVSDQGLVRALKSDRPKAFTRSGFLRHYRLLRLNEQGRTDLGGRPVLLHPQLGLVLGELVARALLLASNDPSRRKA